MTEARWNPVVLRTIFCVAVLLSGGHVLAADLPPKPAPKHTPASNTEAPAEGSGPLAAPDATCLEWSDGCRTCQRPSGGEAACSNVGIACTPKDMQCTKR